MKLDEAVDEMLRARIERLRGDYETSHASRVHADTAVLDLEAEVERLRAQVDTLTDVIERIGTTAEARIDAALTSAAETLKRIQFAPAQERETVEFVVGMIVAVLKGEEE